MVIKVEYSRKEIRDLLLMIDVGNRPRWSQKGPIGLKRTVSAFGIVGMLRSYGLSLWHSCDPDFLSFCSAVVVAKSEF